MVFINTTNTFIGMEGNPQSGGLQKSYYFQGEMAYKEAPLYSNCHKT